MVRVIVADKKLDCSHLVGKFLDESHYDTLITEDCDAYMPAGYDMSTELDTDVEKIIFKFRKNFFTKQQQDDAYRGLRAAATESQNRGLAAGPKGDKLQNRDWVTDEHIDILEAFMRPESSLFDVDPIDEIRSRYANNSAPSIRILWTSF
jgi:hypothetical protein